MSERIPVPPESVIEADVARALAEDLGSGDVTAALLPDVAEHGYVIAKEAGVIAGRPWFDACFRALDPFVRIDWRISEGDRVAAGDVLCTFSGRSRALVSAERCALNFLQTLSGTATRTGEFVAELAGSRTRVLDTRKTLPGLRIAQKYAVRVGGGVPGCPTAAGFHHMGATTYHDIQFGWKDIFGVDGLKWAIGINNAFDRDPPPCVTCSLNGYDAGTYDIQGRFWYTSIDFKF